ncbi:MAG: Hsp20/alpha crystallin family protein [Bacteroidia bacterium]
MSSYSDNDEALFGRSIDDFLLYDSALFSDKETHEFRDKYIVEITVPGFKSNNLQLVAENDVLILRGFEIQKEKGLLRTKIIKIPVFQRTLVLPPDAAPNTISAQYLPGILKITCPKQAIPFNHNRKHYLVQTRRIRIVESDKKVNWIEYLKGLFKKR